jgi:hypothetical protein
MPAWTDPCMRAALSHWPSIGVASSWLADGLLAGCDAQCVGCHPSASLIAADHDFERQAASGQMYAALDARRGLTSTASSWSRTCLMSGDVWAGRKRWRDDSGLVPRSLL